jgi:DNA-binding GntR family transcriptional regulator
MEPVQSTIASRSSLSEQVRNHILARIATGQFPPGHKIVEARIAEELHVSTIPVREAIRELVAKRVLEYLVHRGARVREVSMAETIDALRVKAVLEALAARLAGPKLIALAPQLRAFLRSILESATSRDFVEYQDQNQHFHRAIVEASGNQILLTQWDSLAFEVRTRFLLDYLKVVDPQVLAREHADILRAIEEGATETVAGLLNSHANHLVEYLQRQMSFNATGRSETGAFGRPENKEEKV